MSTERRMHQRLAAYIERAIEKLPMERRLYPDSYARQVADAVLDKGLRPLRDILTEDAEPAWDAGELAKQYADRLNRIAALVMEDPVEFKATTKGSKR